MLLFQVIPRTDRVNIAVLAEDLVQRETNYLYQNQASEREGLECFWNENSRRKGFWGGINLSRTMMIGGAILV